MFKITNPFNRKNLLILSLAVLSAILGVAAAVLSNCGIGLFWEPIPGAVH
jgi:hypothetical protein